MLLRLLTPLLAVTLALSAIACSGDDDPPAPSPTPTATTSSAGASRTPGATETAARAQYCKDLDSFKKSAEQIKNLSTKSSVDDVKKIKADLSSSWDRLKDSAKTVGTVKLDRLDAALDNFEEAVDDLPQNASIQTTITSLLLPIAEVVQEGSKIEIEGPCP